MKLVYGVGINDADYAVRPTINGRHDNCPFYLVWQSMLRRCYSEKSRANHPTYIGCTVCDDWLIFSNFKRWMEAQDWQGMELDKDLLIAGNKTYSPSACVFVDSITNTFMLNREPIGEWPIGVSFHKRVKKFQAACSNPFTKKNEHLGYFHCAHQAHQAWKKRKHELALQLADLQADSRVANNLRNRYL